MREAFIGAVFAIALPFQAGALSCTQPDVAASFTAAVQSEARYTVLWGRFSFTQDTATAPTREGQAPDPFVVHFQGQGLSANGFVDVSPRNITIAIGCAGPWCGSFAPETEALAFVERTADGDVLRVGPCAQWVFQDPSRADIAKVEACMHGDACDPVEHR